MNNLTKEERHEIYKHALESFNAYVLLMETHYKKPYEQISATDLRYSRHISMGGSPYLCDNLKESANEVLRGTAEWKFILFPEFNEFKPEGRDYTSSWWHTNDRKSRLNCLNICIEKTKSNE